MAIEIHTQITNKLDEFTKLGKIPNILFHGPNGSGKRTLVNNFINKLYRNNKEHIRSYVLYTNCAHAKGIKFVREDLKFFAKTHISLHTGIEFKTIILSNADSLTIDAQSALRRCIEQFSHNTRFFVIVNDKAKILKPILSRFCEIYIPHPLVKNKKVQLYSYHSEKCFGKDADMVRCMAWFKKNIINLENKNSSDLIEMAESIYERGYSGKDLLVYIDMYVDMDALQKSKLLLTFHKVKKDFRNEKLLLLFMLHFLSIRSNNDFENVSFM
jgi:Cdc6-like AAA superfamily ATPase